jgi:hypothetical protein
MGGQHKPTRLEVLVERLVALFEELEPCLLSGHTSQGSSTVLRFRALSAIGATSQLLISATRAGDGYVIRCTVRLNRPNR